MLLNYPTTSPKFDIHYYLPHLSLSEMFPNIGRIQEKIVTIVEFFLPAVMSLFFGAIGGLVMLELVMLEALGGRQVAT